MTILERLQKAWERCFVDTTLLHKAMVEMGWAEDKIETIDASMNHALAYLLPSRLPDAVPAPKYQDAPAERLAEQLRALSEDADDNGCHHLADAIRKAAATVAAAPDAPLPGPPREPDLAMWEAGGRANAHRGTDWPAPDEIRRIWRAMHDDWTKRQAQGEGDCVIAPNPAATDVAAQGQSTIHVDADSCGQAPQPTDPDAKGLSRAGDDAVERGALVKRIAALRDHLASIIAATPECPARRWLRGFYHEAEIAIEIESNDAGGAGIQRERALSDSLLLAGLASVATDNVSAPVKAVCADALARLESLLDAPTGIPRPEPTMTGIMALAEQEAERQGRGWPRLSDAFNAGVKWAREAP